MLTHLDPASALAVGLLIFALLMVVMFEATNGFHDAANAVATVIYTRSLSPTPAGLRYGMLSRILTAWLLTLPVTILVSGTLYYVLTSPRL